jgi:hypothetical protein
MHIPPAALSLYDPLLVYKLFLEGCQQFVSESDFNGKSRPQG